MSIARTILTSSEAANIIGKPEIINAVRICTIRQASLITWPSCTETCCKARLLDLLKTILSNPTIQAWFDTIIYYVVINNPQIDWEHYLTDTVAIEAEINFACFEAIYAVVGCTIPGTMVVTSNPTGLTETNIDRAVLSLALSNNRFVNSTLDALNFTLQNAPVGLTVASVSYVSETAADVTLDFDGTDFGDTLTNMTITIAAAELSGALDIVSPAITVTGVAESVLATSTPTTLTEATLNGSSIQLDLTNETFVAVIDKTHFTLNNAPANTTVLDAVRSSATRVSLILSYDLTDFDTDISNFFVTVAGDQLTRGNALTTQNMAITAVVE